MFAAQQADKCLEAGDLDGKAVWMRVIRAIEEPTNTDAPGGGQSVHRGTANTLSPALPNTRPRLMNRDQRREAYG